MKWILLVFMNLLSNINCDYNGNFATKENNVKLMSAAMPAKNIRGARTLSFDSKEDESGIHLHIWNDLNNRDNFYPHLMKQIAETSLQNNEPASTLADSLTSTTSQSDNSNHIHINLNEPLPQPQPQISPENLLKSTLLKTFGLDDEYRKSDQNSYENSFYKFNAKPNAPGWNYHPSTVHYIPKTYDTNLNNVVPGYFIKTVSSAPFKVRPTLHDQMDNSKSSVHEYYTNLRKKKPKSVIDAVGYEIGGLPKYSGRLLANEPMPQQYRTFQMFEPVPRQIMLPPPTRIPEFKPVPPRLKIIPVIDEYLDIPMHSQQLPWTVIKPVDEPAKANYIYPTAVKPVQIIPFKASEAITKAPFRKYIPKTEYNYIEPTTESNYQTQPIADSETYESRKTFFNKLKPPKIPIKAPKLIDHLGNNQDIYNQENYYKNQDIYHAHSNPVDSVPQYSDEPMNGQFMNHQQNHNDSKAQVIYNAHHPYEYEYEHKQYITKTKQNNNDNVGADTMKLVSNEDSRITLNNDIIDSTKKSANKKAKTPRKPHRTPMFMNDVVKLNVTGFHNVSEDEAKRIKNHRSPEFGSKKKESKLKDGNQFYGQTQSMNNHALDSVSADSIQLSQTYSKQTTNVANSKTTPPTIRHQDSLLMELANDVKKALLTSMGNQNKSIEYQTDEFEEDGQKDPFLIAVYDEKDSAKHEHDNHLDDVTIEELRRRDSISRETRKEGHIQRIHKDFASDRKDVVKQNVNKRADDNNHHRKNESKNTNYASNHRNDSETSNQNETHDQLNNGVIEIPNDIGVANSTSFDDKYYKWFSKYAEEKAKNGRTVISEHFKKVEIEPNISWVILPRENATEHIGRIAADVGSNGVNEQPQ